jgi:hypothetical protein
MPRRSGVRGGAGVQRTPADRLASRPPSRSRGRFPGGAGHVRSNVSDLRRAEAGPGLRLPASSPRAPPTTCLRGERLSARVAAAEPAHPGTLRDAMTVHTDAHWPGGADYARTDRFTDPLPARPRCRAGASSARRPKARSPRWVAAVRSPPRCSHEPAPRAPGKTPACSPPIRGWCLMPESFPAPRPRGRRARLLRRQGPPPARADPGPAADSRLQPASPTPPAGTEVPSARWAPVKLAAGQALVTSLRG